MKLDRQALSRMPVIDMHCHADIPWQGIQTTPRMILDLIIQERLAYSLILGRHAETQIPVLRQLPGRCGLLIWSNPAIPTHWPHEKNLLLANRDVVQGIKLHPSMDNYLAGLSTLDPIFAAANKHDFLIATHTDDSPNSRSANYARLLEKYPQTKLILYHASPLDEALALIAAYPNVYLDTSASSFNEALQRKALATVGPTKILFGIDSPLGYPIRNGTYQPHVRDVVELEIANWFDHDAEVLEQVLWKNAARLLGIEVDPAISMPAEISDAVGG